MAAAAADDDSSCPSLDLEIPSVGSPEHTESHLEIPPPGEEAAHGVVFISDDLRDKIIKQVEYYFSDENLPTDKFMQYQIQRDKEGFVPVPVLASFRKMKRLSRDHAVIVAALKESSQLVVSSDGKKIKRRHPLPSSEVKDAKLCTVLVENLPQDHSADNLRTIFGEVGNIKNISIFDPQAVNESTKGSKKESEKLISRKLHALVEYETTEAAEKAVATLNNEQDWRTGMRVKSLKDIGMYGKKTWRGSETEKISNPRGSSEAGHGENHNSNKHHDESHDEEDSEHVQKEKAEQKNRRCGRSRGQKYHGTNGHGHGTTSSIHGIEASKPPPGPRMPDGTRGFTMGRGRPLPSGASPPAM